MKRAALFLSLLILVPAGPAAPQDQAGNPADWPLKLRGRNYEVWAKGMRERAMKVLEHMDLAYSLHAKVLDGMKAPPEKLRLYLYGGEKEYRAAGGPKDASAYYDSGRFIAYFNPAHMFVYIDKESFLQVADVVFKDVKKKPVWLIRGMADCFLNSAIGGSRVYACKRNGPATDQLLKVIRGGLDRALPLQTFLVMTETQYSTDPQLYRAQCWSFCHFLVDRGGNALNLNKLSEEWAASLKKWPGTAPAREEKPAPRRSGRGPSRGTPPPEPEEEELEWGNDATEHVAFKTELGIRMTDAGKKMVESLYSLWEKKLGQAVKPESRLRIQIHFERKKFFAVAPVGRFYFVKDGVLHILNDWRGIRTFAAGGCELYLTCCYPDLLKRTDLPWWLVPGLCHYFGTVNQQKDNLRADTLELGDIAANVMLLKKRIKDRDWIQFKKAFQKSRESEKDKGTAQLEAWAVVYWIINAPGDSGGKGKHAAALPELLTALNSGKKTGDALAAFYAKTGVKDEGHLEKTVKRYVRSLKTNLAPREEDEWLVGETKYYTIYCQKGNKNRKMKWDDKQVLEDLKLKMDLLYEKYALAFGFHGLLMQRPVLYFFKSKGAYLDGGGFPGALAFYMPDSKLVVSYNDSDTSDMVFNIICHECCHQFFDLAFPGFYQSKTVPYWFSEGLAECFGASEMRGKELFIFTLSGTGPKRIERLRMSIEDGNCPRLEDLVEMSPQRFMAGASLNYAASWAFCHFLWNYPSQDKGKGHYYQIIIKLIDGFKKGKPRNEVYKEAFKIKGRQLDLGVLEEQWKAYVQKLRIKQ
ncbi:MAG: DUF1570 domain-containing protein [Planctomycetota bacterium]|jgi:hypothetical protein